MAPIFYPLSFVLGFVFFGDFCGFFLPWDEPHHEKHNHHERENMFASLFPFICIEVSSSCKSKLSTSQVVQRSWKVLRWFFASPKRRVCVIASSSTWHPTTIKTMGVNRTTIVYLRVLIIQIGSTIILMVVEA